MARGVLKELLADLAQLAEDAVEEWLSPRECRARLLEIVSHYRGERLTPLAERCLDDAAALADLVVQEGTTPDVFQEYLLFLAGSFAGKARRARQMRV